MKLQKLQKDYRCIGPATDPQPWKLRWIAPFEEEVCNAMPLSGGRGQDNRMSRMLVCELGNVQEQEIAQVTITVSDKMTKTITFEKN